MNDDEITPLLDALPRRPFLFLTCVALLLFVACLSFVVWAMVHGTVESVSTVVDRRLVAIGRTRYLLEPIGGMIPLLLFLGGVTFSWRNVIAKFEKDNPSDAEIERSVFGLWAAAAILALIGLLLVVMSLYRCAFILQLI